MDTVTAGYFTTTGLPYVEARVLLPRLGVAGPVDFLVDTGSVSTILHPRDAIDLYCPFDDLTLPVTLEGVGSTLTYFREIAHVTLGDGDAAAPFVIEISIAKPDSPTDGLPSLLGRDVLNRVRMEYDFPQNRLELA